MRPPIARAPRAPSRAERAVIALATLAAVAAGACGGGVSDPATSRRAVLRKVLLDADRDLILTRPDLVAEKYRSMGASLHDFLRGTAVLYYFDATRGTGDLTFVHAPGAERVPLYGDPHLENVGANFDDDRDPDGMLFEATDFDATVDGPFDWDVRRAAVGVATVLHLAGLDAAGSEPIVGEVARGYLEAIEAAASGPPAPLRRSSSLGEILDDHLRDARARRDRREELMRSTEVKDGVRRVTRADAVRDLPPEWRAALDEGMARYLLTRRAGPGAPGAFTIKDAAQRFGAGVASLPNLRFWVLVENGPGIDDDLVLEWKEQRDPPEPVALLGRGPASAEPPANAARIAAGMRRLISSPTAERDYGYARLRGVSFQIRREIRGRRNLDAADLASDLEANRISRAAVAELARNLGRLLGNGHARAGGLTAVAAIRAAAPDPTAYAAITASGARQLLDRLVADHALFKQALADESPSCLPTPDTDWDPHPPTRCFPLLGFTR